MDTKVMIGIGVAIAAAAGIGIYVYTKKAAPGAPSVDNQSDKKTPQVNAYAPPAGGGEKSTTDKVKRDVADAVKFDAECFKQFPDRTSGGYISCMSMKTLATL